jgi:hypothetical protein
MFGKVLMSFVLAIIIIVAVALLITGGMIQSLNFLLWVGGVLLIVSVISFLLRSIGGRR